MNDFNLYFSLGWEHILSRDAMDHILFIVALAVVFRLDQWKQVLILVTAFTIGHFITLWLSVLDLVRFSSMWVEFLIPLTIVATAFTNLFNMAPSTSARVHYGMALGFGLIHGMGYANNIRFMLVEEQSLGWSLFAFNLGLELGQLLVVLTTLLVGALAARIPRLSRKYWVMTISLIILVMALNMAVDRIPKI